MADIVGTDSGAALGSVVISMPAGWTYQHQVTIQLPHIVTMGGDDFQPNIVVVKHPLRVPGTKVEAVADERRRLLARHLPQFEFDLSTRIELLGRSAVRIMYTWHNGVQRLRQMAVLWVSEDSSYEFTYTDISSRFGDTVIEFERWLGGLGLTGVPPVSAAPTPAATPP